MSVILKTYEANWLKNSHKIERILGDSSIEEELITSCFGIIKFKEKIAFCNHKVRGMEIPGGHKEPGEHSIQTLIREIKEETGLTNLINLKLLVLDKITLLDKQKPNYKYPYPISYQAFFYGEALQLGEIEEGLDSTGVVFLDKHRILDTEIYDAYKEIFDLIL